MNTIIDLMNTLNNTAMEDWAQVAVDSKIVGAKDCYLAMGKGHGVSVKELEVWWKAAQPIKATGGAAGFAGEYYDWLAEDSRTEQDATDYIMAEDNSANTKKHLSHYLNIWALAESVRTGTKVSRSGTAPRAKSTTGKSKAKAEPEWEYNDADPFADERSAKETLKREMKRARPRKTRIHPDKVSKFGDEELTNLFTEAFKKLFG